MDIMLKIAEWIPPRPFPQIISIFAYAFFLWFSSFIVTRTPRKNSTIVISISMITIGLFIASSILETSTNNRLDFIKWNKFLNFFSIMSVIFWLHSSLAILLDEIKNKRQDLSVHNDKRFRLNYLYPLPAILSFLFYIFYLISFIFGIGGNFGNWLYNYNHVTKSTYPLAKWMTFIAPVNDGYIYFGIYGAFALLWSVVNLITASKKSNKGIPESRKYLWITYGSVFFFLGGFSLIFTQITIPLPDSIGHTLLASGALFMGYAVARYNAIVEGKVIKEKFLSNFWSVFSLLAIFIALFFVTVPNTPIPALLILSTFIVLTYVFFDSIRERWEKRFLDPRISSVKISTERLAAKMSEINIADVEMWLEKAKTLSEAECRIFDAIGKGLGKHGYDDISSELFVSKNTVDAHLKNIRKKLGCCKSAELPLVWLVVNFLPDQEKMGEPEMSQE